MPRRSAGLLLYRRKAAALEVLLVHPGGPFWAKKDEGAWSIPKGELEEGEDPLATAQREFEQETGAPVPEGELRSLEPVRQSGGKVVHAWALCADFDPSRLKSNRFSMEWPPRSGRETEFPEVDRAEWFSIDRAAGKINPGQRPLLEQLARIVAGE